MLFMDPTVSLSMLFEITADVFGKGVLVDEINELPWYSVAKMYFVYRACVSLSYCL